MNHEAFLQCDWEIALEKSRMWLRNNYTEEYTSIDSTVSCDSILRMYVDCIIQTEKKSEIEEASKILLKRKPLPFTLHTQWIDALLRTKDTEKANREMELLLMELRNVLADNPSDDNRWCYFQVIRMRLDHFNTFHVSENDVRVELEEDLWLDDDSKEILTRRLLDTNSQQIALPNARDNGAIETSACILLHRFSLLNLKWLGFAFILAMFLHTKPSRKHLQTFWTMCILFSKRYYNNNPSPP
uniref:AlNc14C148G7447 protein n=1 Tax=Albugo laibachii Nc14 TaxID=890382 RepID=F0WLR5_9STRA|nr:AlNc14C148G7447 [Albugo laibachii Nc14]|eukprot:CCA22237.1 AlNc14C148G7447 [Albugo laibachii Nc14]